MQGNLYPFDLISTSMLNVQPEGKKTLDHIYSIYTETRTKLSLTLHLANLTIILSTWFQFTSKIKAASTSDPAKWSDEADAKLQDYFASTDWKMLWGSSDGIEKYTTSVTGFINKCIDDIVPTVTVRTFPNQQPRFTGNILA